MNTSFKYVLTFALCSVVLSSCIRVVEIDYPDYQPQIVLTGVMQPDSILKIRLRKTQPLLSAPGSYPAVVDATVFCYENDKEIGQLKHEKNGFYRLDYFPKEGANYRVEVLYSNTKITAEDTIPFASNVAITMGASSSNNPNGNPDLFLSIARSNISYTWLSAVISYNLAGSMRTNGAVILSSFPIFDTFNAYKSLSGIDSFQDYARLKPDFFGDYVIKFTVTNQVSAVKIKGDSFYFRVSDLSQNYDRYLKSSLTAYANLPNEDIEIGSAFAEPIQVFSNVKNGIGLLGAMQTRKIVLKKIE